MFLLGFRRKLTVLALCKLIESAIQWFQIHHRITFATMQKIFYLGSPTIEFCTKLVPNKFLCHFVFEHFDIVPPVTNRAIFI